MSFPPEDLPVPLYLAYRACKSVYKRVRPNADVGSLGRFFVQQSSHFLAAGIYWSGGNVYRKSSPKEVFWPTLTVMGCIFSTVVVIVNGLDARMQDLPGTRDQRFMFAVHLLFYCAISIHVVDIYGTYWGYGPIISNMVGFYTLGSPELILERMEVLMETHIIAPFVFHLSAESVYEKPIPEMDIVEDHVEEEPKVK